MYTATTTTALMIKDTLNDPGRPLGVAAGVGRHTELSGAKMGRETIS